MLKLLIDNGLIRSANSIVEMKKKFFDLILLNPPLPKLWVNSEFPHRLDVSPHLPHVPNLPHSLTPHS